MLLSVTSIEATETFIVEAIWRYRRRARAGNFSLNHHEQYMDIYIHALVRQRGTLQPTKNELLSIFVTKQEKAVTFHVAVDWA